MPLILWCGSGHGRSVLLTGNDKVNLQLIGGKRPRADVS